MKNTWKTILTSVAMPLRLVIFIFGGRGEEKWRPAGRYTKPDQLKVLAHSAKHPIG